MHFLETKFSELKDRIDADFYILHKELLDFNFKGLKVDSVELGQLVKNIFRGKSPGREGYLDKGVLVIKSVNIGNYFLEKTRFSYAKEEFYKRNKRFNPREEEIILTSTGEGTIGRAIIFLPKIYGIDKCLVTEKVTVLRNINKQRVSPYYLLAFLWSNYGKKQLKIYKRGSTGRTELYPKDIEKVVLLVPNWNIQKEIENLVKQAHQRKKLADEKYKKAEKNLYMLLGFEKFDLEFEKSFKVKAGEVFSSMRFDAEYYQSKYKKVIDILYKSQFKIEKLERVINISTRKISPKNNPTKKIKYIELADINALTGEIENFNELFGYEAPSRARMLIKKGDVLVASLTGSLNKIGLVPEGLDGEVASTGFFVINSKNYLSEFLLVLFKSELLKKQLEQKTTGAIMSAIPKKVFRNLLVPIIPKQKQKKVTELMKKSFLLRKESRVLLSKAKKKVENLIENNSK